LLRLSPFPVPHSVIMSAPSLSKLTRLQTSTLTLLLERQRSLSLSLAPSQSTETTILRNLNQLNDGIEELFLEADDEGGEQGEKCGWKKLDEGLERLMGMWEEGGGEEKVRGIREGIRSVVGSFLLFRLLRKLSNILLRVTEKADASSTSLLNTNDPRSSTAALAEPLPSALPPHH
jgi:hypothetical protein